LMTVVIAAATAPAESGIPRAIALAARNS